MARQHGPSEPRHWRKAHLGIDAKTPEIRALEIMGSRFGEAPILPDLLHQIPSDQEIATSIVDGAFDTRVYHCFGGLHGPIRSHASPHTIAERTTAAAIRLAGKAGSGRNTRHERAQRSAPQLTSPRPSHLEARDRLSSARSGRGKDALAASVEPMALTRSS